MRESLAAYCARLHRRDLLSQWDGSRNGTLTPDTVSYGSRQKLWWRCEQGHVWQAAVYTRAGGESGCPYCAGKRPWPGFNDLASRFPDLAKEWHPIKNGGLTPDQVLWGSNRRVWWQCAHGHVWDARVKSRAAGAGCPYCASRQISPGDNDLAAQYPDLAAQWHPTKNGGPAAPGRGGRQPPEGLVAVPQGPCVAGGHCLPGWRRRRLPGVRRQAGGAWGERPGHPLPPAGPAVGPGRRTGPSRPSRSPRTATAPPGGGVRWATAGGRPSVPGLGGATAPTAPGARFCLGSTTWPPETLPWQRSGHPDLNGALTPQMVTAGSHKKAWWRCPENHVWKAVVYSRTGPKHCGCPVCAGKVSQRNQVRYPIPTGEPRGPRRLSQDGAGSREETLAKTKTL